MAVSSRKSLDPRLDEYIESLRESIGTRPMSRLRLDTLAALASRFVSEPLNLRPDQRRAPSFGYGRNLLHIDREHGFVVLAMVWPPGAGGLPHDHGTWGVIAVAEGEMEIIDYEVEPIDPRGEFVRLRETSCFVARRGETACILPPKLDVHRIRNPSTTKPALTIHTYGREITRFRTFDPLTGRVGWIEPAYHSVPPGERE